MGKTIKSEKLSESITLSECTDGFWLYDKTRGMNLAMRSESRELAFLSTIDYYQERLLSVESEYATLKERVDNFVGMFSSDEDDL